MRQPWPSSFTVTLTLGLMFMSFLLSAPNCSEAQSGCTSFPLGEDDFCFTVFLHSYPGVCLLQPANEGNLQSKKIYQAQSTQHSALTRILQRFRKTSTPLVIKKSWIFLSHFSLKSIAAFMGKITGPYGPANFQTAKAACEDLGQKLLTIDSREEENFLKENLDFVDTFFFFCS